MRALRLLCTCPAPALRLLCARLLAHARPPLGLAPRHADLLAPAHSQIDQELARARAELERKKELAREKRERRKREMAALLERGASASRTASIDEDVADEPSGEASAAATYVSSHMLATPAPESGNQWEDVVGRGEVLRSPVLTVPVGRSLSLPPSLLPTPSHTPSLSAPGRQVGRRQPPCSVKCLSKAGWRCVVRFAAARFLNKEACLKHRCNTPPSFSHPSSLAVNAISSASFQRKKSVTFATNLVEEQLYIERTPLPSHESSMIADSPIRPATSAAGASKAARAEDDDLDALFAEAEDELKQGSSLPRKLGRAAAQGADVLLVEDPAVLPSLHFSPVSSRTLATVSRSDELESFLDEQDEAVSPPQAAKPDDKAAAEREAVQQIDFRGALTRRTAEEAPAEEASASSAAPEDDWRSVTSAPFSPFFFSFFFLFSFFFHPSRRVVHHGTSSLFLSLPSQI